MSNKPDGGPAFAAAYAESADYEGMIQRGLSMRDYLAAHAPADVSRLYADESIRVGAAFIGIPAEEYKPEVHWHMIDAKCRYQWADAMLLARDA